MIPRERIITSLDLETPDKVPKHAFFTHSTLKLFKKKTGKDSPEDYFNMEARIIKFEETKNKLDFSKYLPDLPEKATINEWGVAYIPGSMPNYVKPVHPMKCFKTIDEINSYPFPDIMADYRHSNLETKVNSLKTNGLAAVGYVSGAMSGAFFDAACELRGYDKLLMDFYLNPEFAETLLDRIVDVSVAQAERFAQAGVDIIRTGDDVGMQKGMIMSPDMWRKFLKPRLSKIIKSVKRVNTKIHFFYHSDGKIDPIIPDLIEIGVTVLNPVQPECMDPVELKTKYGKHLAFWGTIGTQTTMPFGTPEEVRRIVRERIDTVGKGGGLVIAPTQRLEPDVSWENIVAFFEAVEEYRY